MTKHIDIDSFDPQELQSIIDRASERLLRLSDFSNTLATVIESRRATL